jgi:hypothetical protein
MFCNIVAYIKVSDESLKIKTKYSNISNLKTYFMQTEQQIQDRIDEIDREAEEIKALKSRNRVTIEDEEDISDNYQYNLEWNYILSDLQAERNVLIKQRNTFHEVE